MNQQVPSQQNNQPQQDNPLDGHWLTRSDNQHRGDLYGKPSAREKEREEVLAEWLGPERTAEVFAALRPKFKTIQELVTAFQMNLSPVEIQKLEELQKKWAEIAGKDIALQSKPTSVDIKVKLVRVEVNNSSYLAIIKMYQKVLEERLAFFTHSEFTHLHFVPAGGSAPRNSR